MADALAATGRLTTFWIERFKFLIQVREWAGVPYAVHQYVYADPSLVHTPAMACPETNPSMVQFDSTSAATGRPLFVLMFGISKGAPNVAFHEDAPIELRLVCISHLVMTLSDKNDEGVVLQCVAECPDV